MKRGWQHTARRLKDIRGANSLTQPDAAQIAGVTVRTWRKWETGKKEPHSVIPMARFLVALGINADWLYYGETFEDIRRRVGPLAMDTIPDVKAKHRARVAALTAKGKRLFKAD